MSTATRSEQRMQTVLEKGPWCVLAILTLGGLLFGSARFAVGVLLGGLLAILNFYWLSSILQRLLHIQPKNSASYVVVRYLLRLTLIGVALFGLLRAGTDVYGLIVGLSVLVLNILLLTIYQTMTLKGG